MRGVTMPPMWLVERALVQRLHLPEVERMQQVVVMMLPKLLGEPIKKNTIRPEG